MGWAYFLEIFQIKHLVTLAPTEKKTKFYECAIVPQNSKCANSRDKDLLRQGSI
jgi:hypothetical protein